jgi:hypothetical protein
MKRPIPQPRASDAPVPPEACPICTKQSGTECGRLDCGKREHLTAGIPDRLSQEGRVLPVFSE